MLERVPFSLFPIIGSLLAVDQPIATAITRRQLPFHHAPSLPPTQMELSLRVVDVGLSLDCRLAVVCRQCRGQHHPSPPFLCLLRQAFLPRSIYLLLDTSLESPEYEANNSLLIKK